MPVRLSDLAKETKQTVLKTDLGDLAVTYRPNAITPNETARLTDTRGSESFRVLLALLEKLIVRWDLVGPVYNAATGEEIVPTDAEIPIKKEVLQHVAEGVLGDIFKAVQEDRLPKQKTSQANSPDLFSGSFS